MFDTKGIPATRRERIEAAVVAGGEHVSAPYEAWIAADTFRGGVTVVLTSTHGFARTVAFTLDEEPATLTARVRQTLEDSRACPRRAAFSCVIPQTCRAHQRTYWVVPETTLEYADDPAELVAFTR